MRTTPAVRFTLSRSWVCTGRTMCFGNAGSSIRTPTRVGQRTHASHRVASPERVAIE